MAAKRGPHRLTKAELRRKYAAQKRAAKLEYVQRNGSAKGWKSSDEYKRIERNKKQAFYRRARKEDKIRAEKAQEAIDKAIATGQPVGSMGLKVLRLTAVEEFFWTALNRRGGAQGSIMDEYKKLKKNYGEPVKSIVKSFDGSSQTYSSEYGLESALSAMYKAASAEQNQAAKAGKTGTSGMHLINATSVEMPNGRPLITVEGIRV